MKKNPFGARLEAFVDALEKKGLDSAVVFSQYNVRALTGVDCDNACLLVSREKILFYTDFRYVPAVERLAPYLTIADIAKLSGKKPLSVSGVKFAKIGYEASMPHSRYLRLEKIFPKAELVDIEGELTALRAVKTDDEIAAIKAAAQLNDKIWAEASAQFVSGMTERDMARIIKHLMIEYGDGEAFETIVCIGENAAECHHVPDDTPWDGRKPILVDMGVKLGGYASDMTRNIVGPRPSKLYKKVYNLVREANERAIAAAKSGITAAKLDAVARNFLTKNSFGKAFGHSLGHGVGLEIHEAPAVSKKSKTVLKPGMVITIEPGVYLPGNLGVRVEDLVLITENGCEVLSASKK